MADRAILFVDGNNWYHSLKRAGLTRQSRLDWAAISKKLVGPRDWVATRYYVGALKHYHYDYAGQQKYVAQLELQDSRITVHYGRMEERPSPNPLADTLRRFLRDKGGKLPTWAVSDLSGFASQNPTVTTLKEKATDVRLAVDMCRMAWDDEYDAAYLLSADGDYTHAVDVATAHSKTVYAASTDPCGALTRCVKKYIRLRPDWFADVYL